MSGAPPAAHQVVVKAALRTILGQTILGVLLVCLTLKRRLSPRTYTFTEAGLDGTDAAGRGFWLPWAALESILVQTGEKLDSRQGALT